MKRLIAFSILVLLALGPVQGASAQVVQPYKVLKISLSDSNHDYFYAYVEPDHYFYRVGHEEISGQNAQKQVEQMMNALQLSPDTTVNELAQRINSVAGATPDYFDVRWIDESNHLYTWVWRKSD